MTLTSMTSPSGVLEVEPDGERPLELGRERERELALHAGRPHGRGELGQVRAEGDQPRVLDLRGRVVAPVDLDGGVLDPVLPGGGVEKSSMSRCRDGSPVASRAL